MTPILSPNTQAILLLTAPLIAGRGSSASEQLLTPGEYKRLSRHLRELQHQPADLMSPGADELLRACQPVVDFSRLQRLLGRGFLLSQVLERWQTRAIWVLSRADANYPRRLKARLREDAPAILYGCGEIGLLEHGGLAVVGSRHVDEALIDYTMSVGRLAARARRTLVSGGARGIDQAAMRGALEADGTVCGVLADSFERAAMTREHRSPLIEGQLTLISPYDPSAGFNVGHAMQRNKLIYALADASLVVSSDLNKGGTWTGAVEQLDKLKFVPVYVRSSGPPSKGLDALKAKGALAWPDPTDADTFNAVFTVRPSTVTATPAKAVDDNHSANDMALPLLPPASPGSVELDAFVPALPAAKCIELPAQTEERLPEVKPSPRPSTKATPADTLFTTVRDLIQQIATVAMKDSELATALDVSVAQTKIWLQRLVDEGVLEKTKKPVRYVVRRDQLFE